MEPVPRKMRDLTHGGLSRRRARDAPVAPGYIRDVSQPLTVAPEVRRLLQSACTLVACPTTPAVEQFRPHAAPGLDFGGVQTSPCLTLAPEKADPSCQAYKSSLGDACNRIGVATTTTRCAETPRTNIDRFVNPRRRLLPWRKPTRVRRALPFSSRREPSCSVRAGVPKPARTADPFERERSRLVSRLVGIP